ncbi:uncharacterized protein LOC141640143 [Silene latifolia]|uniref:uncharacterized protein LOC141640143 n=1 Tax=Silene latifolia TaxID=37657 RepID=UPI003D77FB39
MEELEDDLEMILEEEETDHDKPVLEIPATTSVQPTIQITKEDVAGEIKFWSSSVFCYVLGANPPSSVLTGINRVWKAQGIDKISFMPNGIFLVRFKTKEQQQFVLNNGHLLFDNKPVIIKEWTQDTELIKHDVKRIPVWMKLYGLDVKYWGLECLKKLSGVVGRFIKCDDATFHRNFLGFARIMIEVDIGQEFPEVITFLNEHGVSKQLKVPAQDPIPRTPKATEVAMTPVVVPAIPLVERSLPRRFLTRLMRNDRGEKRTVPSGVLTPGGVSIMESLSQSLQKTRLGIIENRLFEKGGSSKSGGRIWLLWEPTAYDIDILDVQIQSIHFQVIDKIRRQKFWMTVVYGLNKAAERIPLWESLRTYHNMVKGPWIVAGDFNSVMASNERIGGAPISHAEIRPMLQTIQDCQLSDLSAKGAFFTWNNKHEHHSKVYSRLDRVFINADWMDIFSDSYVHFLPEGMFDHCPGLIYLEEERQNKGSAFKYYNMWSLAPSYNDIVRTAWQQPVQGTPMFRVVQKLRGLKAGLRMLNREHFADIENLTHVAELSLNHFQQLLIDDPLNEDNCNSERVYARDLEDLLKARDQYLKQKAKGD